jgi:hypothetical protein
MSIDLSDDDDLAPPPKQHADPKGGIDLSGSDDDDGLPPPPKQADSLAIADSLVVPSRGAPGNGIDLDDLDDDDLPPAKPAAAPASTASPAASPASPALAKKAAAAPPAAAATAATKPAAAAATGGGAAAAASAAQRARSGTTKQRKISDVSLEAFLFKQSPSWPYVMQKRWVTLKGRVLSYFEDKGAATASGTLDLQGAQIQENPTTGKSTPHAIGIAGDTPALKGRTFIFAASSREEYLEWVETLKFVTTDAKSNEIHWFEKMALGAY